MHFANFVRFFAVNAPMHALKNREETLRGSLETVWLLLQRVDQVLHVDAHGMARTRLIPLHQKLQNQLIVLQCNLLHVLAVLGNL